MQKISNEQALTFIDSFLTEVKEEKTAEESPITVSTSDTGGEAAGTVPASVEGSMDNSPDKTKDEEGKPTQGAFGKEKSQDMNGAIPTIGVEDTASENNEKVDNERAAGDFGQEAIEGTKEETPSYIEAEKMKVAEETDMINELKRAQGLSNAILAKLAEEAPAAEKTAKVEKTAEEKLAEEVEGLLKEAADEAYHDFVTSYQAGLLKRAQDEAAVQEALGIAPEEASSLLDEVAAEDPEAVMPAEEGIPAEAIAEEGLPAEAMAEEGIPAEAPVEEMPAEMAPEMAPEMGPEMGGEEGIDEEALLQALVEAGVTPEELEAAVGQVGAEDASMQVEAAERQSVLKDLIRSLKQ